jgi:thiol:disulfide interchange protein DsbD
MFGLYELQVPASLRNKLGGAGRGGGVIGSIVLGVVAALVVSPCVGPFVAGILLYVATTGSPFIGFIVLFVFALGLGTLFMIIGTFSSAISALPGAGSWMETVKKFFGFVLLIMALYFVRTIIPPEITAVLAALLLLAFGVFGGGLDRLSPESGFFLRLKKLLGVIAFLIGVYLLLGTMLMQGFVLPPASSWLPVSAGGTASAETHLIDWGTDLDAGLAQAKSESKPVLIDTWATWCANCRVLDKKTFNNPEVAAEAERFVSLKIQLENANSQITKDFMEQFGLKHFSLPTTLLLNQNGSVRKVMQGFVGPDQMIEEMRKVK